MVKKKIYLAHTISTKGEFEDSIRVANLLREEGFDVYAAAENNSINDKTNDPTPLDIYDADVTEIDNCDIFVVNLSGGHQDGTISEVGVVAGINENECKHREFDGLMPNTIPIIAYTSNARLLNTQHHHGMASASANHLVLGMVDKWGKFVGGEEAMLQAIKELSEEVI